MKNLYHFLLILFATFTLVNSAESETYYVNSATGNDARTPVQARNVSTPWLTVQHAIDNAAVVAGDNIVVAEGTYSGFNLTKRVNVIGVWKGSNPATNTIFTSTISLSAPGGNSAQRMALKNLRSTSASGDAIDLRDGYVTLENVSATATGTNGIGLRFNNAALKDILIEACNFNNSVYAGMYFPTFSGVDGLIIRNSTVNNNGHFGVVAFQARTSPSEIKNVQISHCAFIDNNPTNQVQGHQVYFEKLKNSVFENVSVATPPGNNWIGIDINLLSREDYSNISILNSRVIRSSPGSGIWIQARNDLFNPPAALDTVLLRGLTFTNCDTNIAFNRQVKNMTVDKCDLSTYSVYGLVNYTDQGGTINAANNKWQNGGVPDTTVISGGLLTAGNNIISFMPSTDGIFIGMGIQGFGIPPGTTVTGKSPNTVSMSNAATASQFVPQIGFAFNFNTSTDIVRTSLNFVHVANPLPNSIINQLNVSFADLASAIAGTAAGGTIWNVPNMLIPGTTTIDHDLRLISPGTGFLHSASLTTFENLTVTPATFFHMGGDFAVQNNLVPGRTTIGLDNTLIVNGNIVNSGQIVGGNRSDMFIGGTSPSTGIPEVVFGLRTLHLNRANGASLTQFLSLSRLLFLQNGLLSLDSADLVLDAYGSIFNPNPTTSYINTNGSGQFRKSFASNSITSFNYAVGNAGYSPVHMFYGNLNTNIGAHTRVNVVNQKHPQNGCTTDYLNRYWSIELVGMAANSDSRFTYVQSDVVGNEANIVGARWNGFLWDAFTPVNPATNTFSVNGIPGSGDFTGGALGCIGGPQTVINSKVIFQGPYEAAGDSMRTDLQQSGNLPLSQPFNSAPYNYPGTESVSSIPAGVVDWVYVEIRPNPNDPPILNGRRAGFVKSDGSIVDLSGTGPLKMNSVPPGNYYIVVAHRNHIPVMSQNAQPLSNTSSLFDFTSSLSQYFGGDAASVGNGKFGLYAGDANKSFIITSADYLAVTSNLLMTNYNDADVNLSGIVTSADYIFITMNLLKASNVPNFP